jgi:tetratricopeptide (TPR) repeat protein
MQIMNFAKVQIEVGRCVGRKDFDGAIRVLESSLSNSSNDVHSLVMIAMCHRWSNRSDEAIVMAQRALAYDPKSFEAFQLLSEIYAERKEHETAAQFTRLGLDNFPEPTPSVPKFFFWVLRIGALVIPRLKRVEKSAREDLADPNKGVREWHSWAKQYLAWYDSEYRSKHTPTVH